jgi:hypothetical protein
VAWRLLSARTSERQGKTRGKRQEQGVRGKGKGKGKGKRQEARGKRQGARGKGKGKGACRCGVLQGEIELGLTKAWAAKGWQR